jgi:hypothetical protein
MEDPAYIAVPIKDIPPVIVKEHGLMTRAKNGKAYLKVLMSMYGHPAAARLSNLLLFKTIEPDGYRENRLVPCLIEHETSTFRGGIIVDDIGAVVHSEEDMLHFKHALEKVWKIKLNTNGDKFLGMDLKWDYSPDNPTLEYSNNRVIGDGLKRFFPGKTLKGADTPGVYSTRWNNNVSQETDPVPMPSIKQLAMEFAGTFSHLGRTVRPDIISSVNEISQTQSNPTDITNRQIIQLANYMARYPIASCLMTATDMQLRCHYDDALRPHARHKAGAVIYHSNSIDPPEKIGNVTEIMCKLPISCVASILEGEYCAGFLAGQMMYNHKVILEELGYPQGPIQFFGDNTTTVGITNDNMKIKKSKAVDKSFHWFRDKVRCGDYISSHISTDLNASNIFTKSLAPKDHHKEIKPFVRFARANPDNFALKPSVLKTLTNN